jgi:glycosyltransferase involved in cell wall biosynthesis
MQNDRLCLIVPCLSLGGQENAASIMANFFAKKNLDITLITLYNLPHFYKLDDTIKVIDPPNNRSKGNKWGYYIKIIFFLRKNIRASSSERVFSYGDWTNILVIIACIGLKIKVYISDRASPDLKFQWHVNLLRQFLYPKAHGIIAQTQRAAQQKYKMLGKGINIKVIPNPVKPVQLYPEIKRKNYILGVGRHWPVKGIDRLIEAFTFLKGNQNYNLLIAGSRGPATEALMKIVQLHKLKPEDIFLEKVTEMDKLYAECKIFVLPSRSEGFPNALIESMAAGLACISFDCSAGPSEIITDGEDGILVEDGNVPELARQIQNLIDNDKEVARLGNNALKIRERLSLEKIGKQYMEFILD